MHASIIYSLLSQCLMSNNSWGIHKLHVHNWVWTYAYLTAQTTDSLIPKLPGQACRHLSKHLAMPSKLWTNKLFPTSIYWVIIHRLNPTKLLNVNLVTTELVSPVVWEVIWPERPDHMVSSNPSRLPRPGETGPPNPSQVSDEIIKVHWSRHEKLPPESHARSGKRLL